MVMYVFIKSLVFVPATYVEVEKYIFSEKYMDTGSVHCTCLPFKGLRGLGIQPYVQIRLFPSKREANQKLLSIRFELLSRIKVAVS